MKFTTINVHRLDNENTFGLCKNSIETCSPKADSLGTTTKVFYDRLVEKTTLLGESLKKETYNELTQQIYRAEKMCDKLISEIKSMISAKAKSVSDDTIKEKALEAKRFFSPYKNISTLPLGTQFQMTDEFLNKLKANEDMTASFTALGLDKAVSALTASNATFKELWNKRKELMADQLEVPTATASKNEAGKAYQQFCTSLLSDYKALQSAEVKSLLADLDAIRMKYALLVNYKTKEASAADVVETEQPKTDASDEVI